MNAPLLGCDPEFFVVDSGGRLVSAIGLLGGTKKEPRELDPNGPLRSLGVQEDNILAELTCSPCGNAGMFTEVVHYGIQKINDELRERDYRLVPGLSSTWCDDNVLSHPMAKVFGCDPDFDAYNNGAVAPRVDASKARNLRTAGGHLHLGGDFNCPPFVAALMADLYIMLPAVRHETGSERRELYGQAGRFRAKPYGIEYRTPSNFWTAKKPLTTMVASSAFQLMKMLTECSSKDIRAKMLSVPWPAVQKAINEGRYKDAETIYAQHGSEM